MESCEIQNFPLHASDLPQIEHLVLSNSARSLSPFAMSVDDKEFKIADNVLASKVGVDFVCMMPDEMTLEIFSLLTMEELCLASTVSLEWRRIANDHILWKRLCIAAFGTRFAQDQESAAMLTSDWKRNFHRLQRSYIDSSILNVEHRETVLDWCRQVLPNAAFRKVYSGREDGFSADAFHAKCDDHRTTLVIIQSIRGHIFGGYSSTAWSGDSERNTADPDAFIFSVERPKSARQENDPGGPILLKQFSDHDWAIWVSPKWLVGFGGGRDICIKDRCNEEAVSYSYLGITYQPPPHLHSRVEYDCFLAGG